MSTDPRPFVLAETSWSTVKETRFDLAVLPWGATEAHNYHLPYATDNFQVEHVAQSAAQLAWEQGGRSIVLPCIPFGVNTGQLDIDLCMNMSPSTQLAVLQDVVQVLECSGIDKLVIVNGHGGNHFKQMLRELSVDYPDTFACALNWFEAADPLAFFDDPGDHAGDLETSCMLRIAPQLCLPLSTAGDGSAKDFRIQGLKEGWVSAQREWTQVTEDTGVGNPANANAEKGEAFMKACIEKMAAFFLDLGNADLNDMYE